MNQPRFVGLVSIDGRPLTQLIAHFEAYFSRHSIGPARVFGSPKEEPTVAIIAARDQRTPPVAVLQADDGSIVLADGDLFDSARHSSNPSLKQALDILERDDAAGCNNIASQASFVHWSSRKRRLIACRHQFGFGPIFFTLFLGKLVFAPEQASLLTLPIDRSLDLAAVDFFISNGFAPAPLTFLKDIRKLAAGHALRAEPGQGVRIDPYFVPAPATSRQVSDAERRTAVKSLLVAAVDRRRSDGDAGVLLSAGVDSALLVGILTRELGVRCEAFTFRYRGYDGIYNEEGQAKAIAEHFGAQHHVIDCAPADVANELSALTARYGEPFTYGLHSFQMGPLKAAGLSRFFSGGGADCLNIDDSGFANIWYQRLPRIFHRAAELGVSLTKPLVPAIARRAHPFFWSGKTGLPTALYPAIMGNERRRRLYADPKRFDLQLRELHDLLRRSVARLAGHPPADLWRYADLQTFDAEAMNLWLSVWARGNDISIIDPYFDFQLFAYIMRISPSGYGKRHFRELAATMMPAADAFRPKIAQTIPIGEWLRGPLKGLLSTYVTADRLGDIFDMSELSRLIERHTGGEEDLTWLLWGLVSLSVWRTEWLPQQQASTSGSLEGAASAASDLSAVSGLEPMSSA